jgi:hypothetical protein
MPKARTTGCKADTCDDLCFEPADVCLQPERSGDSPSYFLQKKMGQITKGNPQSERGDVHQSGVPPELARRDHANGLTEGKPRVVSEAKDNNANFLWAKHFIHHISREALHRPNTCI